MKSNYSVIAFLIVLSPLLILALHYHNRVEQFALEKSAAMIQFLSNQQPTAEDFAASQGGALIQLATSHVASEEEVAENLEREKRQVTNDIINMTEPEVFPGPRPGSSYR
jgi:hypothetical protein